MARSDRAGAVPRSPRTGTAASAPLTVALAAGGAAVLGAVVGVLAVLVHRSGTGPIPAGLALAVLASPAGAVGLWAAGAARAASTAYGLGWAVAVFWLLAGRPEGDYLVAGDTAGWVFLFGSAGAVTVATVLGGLVPRRRTRGPVS